MSLGRRKKSSRLGVREGETYALMPEEVLNSAAYLAQPDYAKVVLVALASRFHGHNNGNLSLPFSEARKLGVDQQWKLFTGLQLLRQAGLIDLTRQGKLENGTKLCSLYSLGWRSIDKAPADIEYEAHIVANPLPSNNWARWEQPEDWERVEQMVRRRSQGKGDDKSTLHPGVVGHYTRVERQAAKSLHPGVVGNHDYRYTRVESSKTPPLRSPPEDVRIITGSTPARRPMSG